MYITYKVTNLVTQDFYIGSHKTDNLEDDYMGSGRLIRKSIEEYGIENHKKEILGVFDNREESLELEHKLVKEKKLNARLLNLTNGGGSFDYINQHLVFDRASFGRKGAEKTKTIVAHRTEERKSAYLKTPKLCSGCGRALSWEHRKDKYCSQSCAAHTNNAIYPKRKPTHVCKECGVAIPSGKRFCSQNCRKIFFRKKTYKSDKLDYLFERKDKILKQRKQGLSLRKLGKLYNISHSYIGKLLTLLENSHHDDARETVDKW